MLVNQGFEQVLKAPVSRWVNNLAFAWVHYFSGEFEKAHQALEVALAAVKPYDNKQAIFICQTIRFFILLKQGKRDQALSCLKLAMEMGESGQVANHYLFLTNEIAELCWHALNEDIHPQYATWLIRRRKLAHPPHKPRLDQWPWPIRVRLLRTLSVEVDGKPCKPAQINGKPVQLLLALATKGGNQISQAELSDLLWPQSLGDGAISNFSTTLQRLRTLLNQPGAIRLKKGQLSIDPDLVWVDSLALEKILKESQTADADLPLLAEQAKSLVHGDLMDQGSLPFWLVDLRARLKQDHDEMTKRVARP